ncbi:MAG: SdpI family protein [Clostridiales bacterium]|nr:SdpI family protein [Eubacteriales bacterium]MDH7567531.1 SdpI family protein [Clostridiales bacterium]
MKDSKKNNKVRIWILWGLAAVPMLMSAAVYPFLPDEIPLHWNALGQVDRIGAKFPGAFILPAICLLLPLLMGILPRLDPRRENYEKFSGAYYWMRVCFVVVFGIINAVVLLICLGLASIPVDYIVKLLVGIMIMVIGNLMPKVKHNYFVGIKTPWTINSEDIWFATHRHGGMVWFAAGLAMSVLAFIPGTASAYAYFGVIIFAAFEPMVYSYLSYVKQRA